MEFTDRYQALGIPYPDPATMCQGPCEGIGFYPQHREDATMTPAEREAWDRCHRASCGISGRLRSLWRAARGWDRFYLSAAVSRCDGWHFIDCPLCQRTGKRLA